MFDRKSQFDRSFFDRVRSFGPARYAGKFAVVTRTNVFTTVTRTSAFTVVASP